MIWPFNKKSTHSDQVHSVYSAIVAQSRQQVFYTNYQVEDSVSGRFDMLSLHMCLLFIRLRKTKIEQKAFSQELFDYFFKDMDQSLREIGISDVAVPKKIAKLGSLFYGLLEKLTNAIDSDDKNQLIEVINRNVYDEKNLEQAKSLTKYVLQINKQLEGKELNDILAGNLEFSK